MIARFLEIAQNRKDEPALADERHQWSFGELSDRVRAYAEGLSRSHKPPVIYSALRGGPDQVALYLACLSVQATNVPVSASIDHETLARCFGLLPPDAILFDDGEDVRALRARYADALPPRCRLLLAGMRAPTELAEVQGRGSLDCLPSSVRFVQMCSEPGRAPRALLFTEASFAADLAQSRAHFRAYRGASIFTVLEPSHPVSCSVILGHLLGESGIVVSNRSVLGEPLAELQRSGARGVLASAEWLEAALGDPRFAASRLPSIREIVLAAGPAPADLVRRLARAFPGVPLHVRFGIEESIGALFRHDVLPGKVPSPGYLGRPVPGVEICPLPELGARESGELRVRTPALAIAYCESCCEWDLLADEEGWFGTGRQARVDAAGGVYLA